MTGADLQKHLEAAGTKVRKNAIRKVVTGEWFHYRTPRKTPLLRPIHAKNSLQFDEDHLNKPAKFLDFVL